MNDIVTIINVYNYVRFEHNKENKSLYIIWDCANKDVHSIMDNESLTRDDDMYIGNHSWVDEIKKCSGWEKGNRLYLRTYYFYKNMFCIKYKHHTNGVYAYEEIDEDGYLLLRKYIDEKLYYGELERSECLYNRNLNK